VGFSVLLVCGHTPTSRQRGTRREEERDRGKATETSLCYGTGEKQLLLHANENFLLDRSFYLQVCVSVSGQELYCSPLTFRVLCFSFAVCLALRDASECLVVCGKFFVLYFLSGSIVVCCLSIWLPRFFFPAPSSLVVECMRDSLWERMSRFKECVKVGEFAIL